MSTEQTPFPTATQSTAAPPHLDSSARNERLYQLLLKMGFWVDPVYSDPSMKNIRYLRVSVSAVPPSSY